MSSPSADGEEELQEQGCDREMYQEMLAWLGRRVELEEIAVAENGIFTEQDLAFLRQQGIVIG